MSHGKLVGIAIRGQSRASMQSLDSANVTAERGVEGDFRGRPGNRQVTVLSREAWETACGELGQDLDWTIRRANLLVEGVALPQEPGGEIEIGDVLLKVCGETDPCARMDEQVAGLTAALLPDWRGGVCCQVLRGGGVAIGSAVRVESANA